MQDAGLTFSPCEVTGIAKLTTEALREGAINDLDTGCVAGARRAPFVLD